MKSLEIILTKGLPGSGKSTWAKAQLTKFPGKYKRINKDDLRSMFDDSIFSKINEKFILKIRDEIVIQALNDGFSVIIDDTNLNKKHLEVMKDIAHHYNKLYSDLDEYVTVKIESFLHVPLETCIKNDLKRFASVGEKVIRDMYEQYIEVKTPLMIQDKTLQRCILVDIDGTVADKNDRSPFDWAKVGEDTPKEHVLRIVQELEFSGKYKIIFFSGRDGCCYDETYKWLAKHYRLPFELFMRTEKDMRKDSIVKKEMFETHIKNKYFVEAVIDDRDQVVSMWRKELGLTCFQVDYGNF